MKRNSILLGLAVLAIASPLFATTVLKMDLQDLVTGSDSIVQGRVESVETRWENKLAFTYTSVIVDEEMKGAPRRAVLIRLPGGKVGSLSVHVAGMPQFKTGDQVILFLKGRPDGTFDVVGMNQGKYDIEQNSAIAHISGITLFNDKTGRMEGAGFVDKAPLDLFKAKIRELVK
jgi:hypothetical protein